MVYERRGRDISQEPGWGGRGWMIVFALFLGAVVALSRLTRRFERTSTVVVSFALGLLGLFLWLLAIISTLTELRMNAALLVFLPTDLAMPFLNERRRRWYGRVRVVGLLLASLVLAVGVLQQPLHAPILVALLPIALLTFWKSRDDSACSSKSQD